MPLGFIFKRTLCVRLVAFGLALLVLPISESAGQARWQRTVKVIVPVEEGMVTRPLTDSVVAMAEAQNTQFRRRPKSDTTMTLSSIRAALSKEGLALTSPTHVFITYRFTQDRGTLRRDILDLHFIYRPSAQQGEDIPILYLDLTEDSLYRRLLVKKGTPLRVNEASFRSFEEQIAFHSLQDDARVVQVGNRVIRDSEKAASEKQRIMKTIRKLTYN
jgi:hypothetical protein